MIYFDNAATGGFKPNSVLETATNVINYLSANPGRSGHRLSKTGANFVYDSRKKLCEFFGGDSPSRVVFTKNCTEALNTAIFGILEKGDHVVTTVYEHNSVLRPLFTLQDKNIIELDVCKPNGSLNVTFEDIKPLIKRNTKAVIINNISNVTGCVNEVYEIGNGLKKINENIIFIVDGAQAGGHIPINMKEEKIDVLALAGHKGLYAIAGSGVLIFKEGIDIKPLTMGGTGTESFNPFQPDCYPERLESGTLNLPAICSLYEGILYLENNINYISMQLEEMTEYLIRKLEKIDEIELFSDKNPSGIVAFRHKKISSVDFAEILSDRYDIAVRGGFHCAPLVHKFLHTDEEGLVRASLSPHNGKREMNIFVEAVKQISLSL